MSDLKSLTFDNRFTRELPADSNTANSRRQVKEACYSRVKPTKVRKPQVVGWSKEVAELIGLDPAECESQAFADVFAGNQLLDGMDPFAMCYGGHQFGNWAGQLGDGRAINLGEVKTPGGASWMLQLKGAGPTPYSRTADGLAVLRSSVREFLCSEAMFHLGVPTTRALSLVLTGEDVRRDMFYDGNPRYEPGAVVCRVAPSFTRFGNFQIFTSRNDVTNLRRLVDFTIRNDFPHLGEPSEDVYAQWFDEVCHRTADMICHWMRVGFVHGVMNTDNMSILGLTIDYGPYGWLEDFDTGWTPNTTDRQTRRYRFGHQPAIAQWNLYQLANALVPLFDKPDALEQSLENYGTYYSEQYKAMMAAKLGFSEFREESDNELIGGLLDLFTLTETDMTIFFRSLAEFSSEDFAREQQADSKADDQMVGMVSAAFYKPEEVAGDVRQQFVTWLQQYRQRLSTEQRIAADRYSSMQLTNPKYVLRNFMAQLAIDQSEQGDHGLVRELLDVLRNPYAEQPEYEQHAAKRPDWARTRAGCSMLSCSS